LLVHCPLEQTLPWGHTLPQVPQFALSVWVFAQYGCPPSGEQSVCPWVQVSVHFPDEQTRPSGQTLPHHPQLALSVAVIAQ
jgi:hypothetical protein